MKVAGHDDNTARTAKGGHSLLVFIVRGAVGDAQEPRLRDAVGGDATCTYVNMMAHEADMVAYTCDGKDAMTLGDKFSDGVLGQAPLGEAR